MENGPPHAPLHERAPPGRQRSNVRSSFDGWTNSRSHYQQSTTSTELLSCTSGLSRGSQFNKATKSSLHCYLDLPVPVHIIKEYFATAVNQRSSSTIEGDMYGELPSLETPAILNNEFWLRREGNATTYAPT